MSSIGMTFQNRVQSEQQTNSSGGSQAQVAVGHDQQQLLADVANSASVQQVDNDVLKLNSDLAQGVTQGVISNSAATMEAGDAYNLGAASLAVQSEQSGGTMTTGTLDNLFQGWCAQNNINPQGSNFGAAWSQFSSILSQSFPQLLQHPEVLNQAEQQAAAANRASTVTSPMSPISSQVPYGSPVSSPMSPQVPYGSPVSSPMSPQVPYGSPVSSPMIYGRLVTSPISSPLASPMSSPLASPMSSPLASPMSSPMASPSASQASVVAALQNSQIKSNGQPLSSAQLQSAAQYVQSKLATIQNPSYNDVLAAFRGSGVQGISLQDQTTAANAISQAYGINSNSGQASNHVTTTQVEQAFQNTHVQANGKPISQSDQDKLAQAVSAKLSNMASPSYQDVVNAINSSGVQGISSQDQTTVATAIAKLYSIAVPSTATSPAASSAAAQLTCPSLSNVSQGVTNWLQGSPKCNGDLSYSDYKSLCQAYASAPQAQQQQMMAYLQANNPTYAKALQAATLQAGSGGTQFDNRAATTWPPATNATNAGQWGTTLAAAMQSGDSHSISASDFGSICDLIYQAPPAQQSALIASLGDSNLQNAVKKAIANFAQSHGAPGGVSQNAQLDASQFQAAFSHYNNNGSWINNGNG